MISNAILSLAVVAPLLSPGPNEKNPALVAEVLAGKRTEANAAWWGFDEDDSTDALQAAIRSGVRKLVVPNMGKDWVVRPLTLAGNQAVVLEPGVVIAAKRGEYRGGGDSVLNVLNVENLSIQGNGATIRMNKEDYIVGGVLKNLGWQRWFGQYVKAEWRTGLNIRGSKNVSVEGLTIRDTGGDGIMVAGTREKAWSTDVTLRKIVFENNYRQGISVISVDGLTVEGCDFNNTWGTPPSSGVDVEPDSANERICRLVFRNCQFDNNYGDGIEVFLGNLKKTSADVSLLFENCRIKSRWGTGIRVTKIHDDGPAGLVEFKNVVVEETAGYGLKVQDKSASRAKVRFVDCRFKNNAENKGYQGAWAPIWFHVTAPDRTKEFGGIEFVRCKVEDRRSRPFLQATTGDKSVGFQDILGEIEAVGPGGAKAVFEGPTRNVRLKY